MSRSVWPSGSSKRHSDCGTTRDIQVVEQGAEPPLPGADEAPTAAPRAAPSRAPSAGSPADRRPRGWRPWRRPRAPRGGAPGRPGRGSACPRRPRSRGRPPCRRPPARRRGRRAGPRTVARRGRASRRRGGTGPPSGAPTTTITSVSARTAAMAWSRSGVPSIGSASLSRPKRDERPPASTMAPTRSVTDAGSAGRGAFGPGTWPSASAAGSPGGRGPRGSP